MNKEEIEERKKEYKRLLCKFCEYKLCSKSEDSQRYCDFLNEKLEGFGTDTQPKNTIVSELEVKVNLNKSDFELLEHLKKENEQLKAENEQIKKNWHDCFLACSSPYCAAHFPAVEMQGELGNMSKREPEAGK